MDVAHDLGLWLKIYHTQSECQKRWFAAQKAKELGRGGLSTVNRLTGMSRTTISKGMKELEQSDVLEVDRTRRPGGGRKKKEVTEKGIIQALESIVDENTAGDPMSLLKWTCKSTRVIAEELNRKGFAVSHQTVHSLLKDLDYLLQSNRKTLSATSGPDRDAQFRYINASVRKFVRKKQPVISVDAKKKELVGNFANSGREWRKKGRNREVNDHDFRSRAKGIAIPYGAYDVEKNEGLVNVGITSDTAEFAVNSIHKWWSFYGKRRYPQAHELLICADGGGSNGSRNRAWKLNLQEFANKTGLSVTVCHYPPGTSKWNKIEHRMFSFISLNWKAVPLESYETIVNLIGGAKTKTGLKVNAKLDKRKYKKGIKVPDEVFEQIKIRTHKSRPKLNYTIRPQTP